jgi:hypothetical protein
MSSKRIDARKRATKVADVLTSEQDTLLNRAMSLIAMGMNGDGPHGPDDWKSDIWDAFRDLETLYDEIGRSPYPDTFSERHGVRARLAAISPFPDPQNAAEMALHNEAVLNRAYSRLDPAGRRRLKRMRAARMAFEKKKSAARRAASKMRGA